MLVSKSLSGKPSPLEVCFEIKPILLIKKAIGFQLGSKRGIGRPVAAY